MRILHTILIVIFAIAVFCSCSKDDDAKAHRTVLAYMLCDGLDSYIDKDIAEMVEASYSLSAKDNMLVLVEYSNGDRQLMKISQGKKEIVTKYADDFECSNPNNMQQIFSYVSSTYPADTYGLIIGTHADGWFVKSDTIPYKRTKNAIGKTIGNSRPININTFATLLQSQPHYDFILFDCCNMQCIEVAWQLRKYADYIIASPAEIPNSGAPYKTVLPLLFNSTPSAATDEYWDYYSQQKDSVPISMIKTSELENLASLTAEKLSTFMWQFVKPDVPDMNGVVFYNIINGQPIMYDMNNFMFKYLNDADYKQWRAQFDKTIAVRHHCSKWLSSKMSNEEFSKFTVNNQTCGCVSMHVPYYNILPFGDNDFNNLIHQTSWYDAVGWAEYGW